MMIRVLPNRHNSRPWAGRSTDIRIEYSAVYVYIWLESQAETLNVSYRMESASAIAPDRHSASAERVDTLSVWILPLRRLRK